MDIKATTTTTSGGRRTRTTNSRTTRLSWMPRGILSQRLLKIKRGKAKERGKDRREKTTTVCEIVYFAKYRRGKTIKVCEIIYFAKYIFEECHSYL